jgi:hypothetical protein
MESLCFSETLVSTDESAWRQTPEVHHHHHHPLRRENLKSQTRLKKKADRNCDRISFPDSTIKTKHFQLSGNQSEDNF